MKSIENKFDHHIATIETSHTKSDFSIETEVGAGSIQMKQQILPMVMLSNKQKIEREKLQLLGDVKKSSFKIEETIVHATGHGRQHVRVQGRDNSAAPDISSDKADKCGNPTPDG